MRKTIPLLLLSLTLPLAAETMNIQTLNGQVFEDAKIERVNPIGIDIGYVNFRKNSDMIRKKAENSSLKSGNMKKRTSIK